jgi:DtxR family Mn-dependent transcriptional regulator
MTDTRPSAAMEDYLKAIFLLGDEGEAVTTVALAGRLGVAAPSVTHMVKRLHEMGLVLHSPYRGIELTPAGRAVAVEVIRHHRLLELYLVEFLDVPWEKVHEEAERLEHVLSEDLESRIAEKLGQPRVDPHGHPIPSEAGMLPVETTCTLWDALPGTRAVVARVSDRDPGLLSHLLDLGLVPNATVEILDVSPYSGTQTVRVNAATHVLGADLAKRIRVDVTPEVNTGR